jgi:hypothetical protein
MRSSKGGLLSLKSSIVYLMILMIGLVSLVTGIRVAIHAQGTPQFAYTGSADCPGPPNGFNPSNASASELQFYGFPIRPTGDATAVNSWLQLVQGAQHRVCGSSAITSNIHHHILSENKGVQPLTTDVQSPNWAGYDVNGGNNFDLAQGQWTVPRYNGSQSPAGSTASIWVGIGGVNGNHLWQVGTDQDPTNGYQAWYEALPSPPQRFNITISPGDTVFAYVDYNKTSAGRSFGYVKDNGFYTSTGESFTPDRSTAEWIVERDTCSNGFFTPLADFGSAKVTLAYAHQTGQSSNHTIAGYPNTRFTMSEWPSTYASVSGLGSGGNNFVSTWQGNGPGC